MAVDDLLPQFIQTWAGHLGQRLAWRDGLRTGFSEQLDRFFEQLQHAIRLEDPGWLDSFLDHWVEDRVQHEQRDFEPGPTRVLQDALMSLSGAVSEICPEKEALEMISRTLPIISHAIGYVTERETNLRIDQVSQELEKVKLNLERLDKSKSDFISVAAHELKTPLTLIEGYSTMLREVPPANDPTSQAVVLLTGINNGTRRLREIIDDMIDVSMIDNNLLSLHFQPIWINRLLRMVFREFEGGARARQIDLQFSPIPGGDEVTFGDDERLYQAFKNVVINAIKYTPDGGSVKIAGRSLPGFIEIIVQDTGIGIDPDDQGRIFEKFGRLGKAAHHSSGKIKYKGGGPGLGLPITKGIVEAHGGAIWADSPGYDEVKFPGASFHILLPILKVPPDDKTAKLFRPLVSDFSNDVYVPPEATLTLGSEGENHETGDFEKVLNGKKEP